MLKGLFNKNSDSISIDIDKTHDFFHQKQIKYRSGSQTSEIPSLKNYEILPLFYGRKVCKSRHLLVLLVGSEAFDDHSESAGNIVYLPLYPTTLFDVWTDIKDHRGRWIDDVGTNAESNN